MPKISLFIPCSVDIILVDIAEAMVKLFSRLGFSLDYHMEQTCCGQPLITAGHTNLAIDIAKRFIDIFANDEYIVGPAGSCISTIKYEYPKILANEPVWQQRAVDLANRIYEFSEFLVDIAGIEDVNARFDGKVAYHNSCHVLRALGIEEQPHKLLSNVRGAELVPLNADQECCGFGGQFSLKYAPISEAIVGDKVKNFIASGAEVLIMSDPGCLLNIEGYLHRHHPELKAQHLVFFLADNLV